jgi:D-3-phosphoglycerate dehydrogenase
MTKGKQVLIIDDVHEMLIDGLKQIGYEVIYLPDATRIDLLHHITTAIGLVVRTKTQIDAEVINKGNNLKFIARAGAGLDNIDEAAAQAKNIIVFNAGEANADAVGEHTLGMMLSLFAKISKANNEVRTGLWDREGNRGEELAGKTIAIIGFGNTGKAVAKKLSGFDVHVLTYDKYLKNYGNQYAKQATMEEIFEQADVLTLHIPLTQETKAMVNSDYLQKFSKPIWLFNMCRGEVVVTKDVIELMELQKIKGAGFDVLENEKLNNMSEEEKIWFSYIAASDKTVLSPHVAGWTKESYFKISAVLLKKIKDINLTESVS